MSNYRVISSDSHVVEPPDLWSERMDPKFGDRIPRLMKEEPGDMWYVDNAALADVGNFWRNWPCGTGGVICISARDRGHP